MNHLSVEPHPDHSDKVVFKVAIDLPEFGHISAQKTVDRSELIQLVADESLCRQIAAYLVGRLITQWKLDLISGLTDGVGEASAMYLGEQSRQRRSSTAPETDDT